MRNSHSKNTVRYYILLIVLLAAFFFSNDFGLTDEQKTAIVTAVGVDREEDTFILTSQIAIPQSSKQGKVTETVQLVSRGKTVAQAFEEINAKTGWYPKLVFCHLVILGEKTAEDNAFEALDFFLLDEYLSDNCLIATCDGLAADILNVTALVDPSGSLAIQKVLSLHAERVGTVLPSTLREFAIGYFGESHSAYLPIIKTEPQQENVGQNAIATANPNPSSEQETPQTKQDKPVFSAGETALFVGGKRVGVLTKEETFAFNAVKKQLRLATYTTENEGGMYSLTVRRNSPKIQFSTAKDGRVQVKIQLLMTAGLLDSSKPLSLQEGKDVGAVPDSVLESASKRLHGQIVSVFEKSKQLQCDIFGVLQHLQQHEKERFSDLKHNALNTAVLDARVRFRNVR